MKITKKSVCVFIFTGLVGYFSTAFINLLEANPVFYPVYKADSVKTSPDILSQKEIPIEPKRTESEPRTFKVEGYWDELMNQDNKHMIETGEVSNSEDFNIKSGEIWFGLFGRDKESYLASTKIRVRRTDKDWTIFSVKGKEEPLFLVKNLKNLKKGRVETVFRGHTWQEADEDNQELTSFSKGFIRSFRLGGKDYTLRVEEGVSEKNESIWVLLLETGQTSQILHYIDYSGENANVGNLYWVGDLDHDGKLDLFMDFWNYEKGGYSSGLYLSSEANKGKLVKEFDYFRLAGC
jgi:hypothetical protein